MIIARTAKFAAFVQWRDLTTTLLVMGDTAAQCRRRMFVNLNEWFSFSERQNALQFTIKTWVGDSEKGTWKAITFVPTPRSYNSFNGGI